MPYTGPSPWAMRVNGQESVTLEAESLGIPCGHLGVELQEAGRAQCCRADVLGELFPNLCKYLWCGRILGTVIIYSRALWVAVLLHIHAIIIIIIIIVLNNIFI